MVRADYIFLDVQDCLMAMFAALVTGGAPWEDWKIIKDYPKSYEFKEFANKKPFIFLERFEEIEKIETQGFTFGQRVQGSDNVQDSGYRMIMEAPIGIWLHAKHGGPDEAGIIKSKLNYIFNPPTGGIPDQIFTVTLGGTEYANTTLYEMGIYEAELSGGREVAAEDQAEFRYETMLRIAAVCGESVVI